MNKERQNKVPIVEALKELKSNRIVPFDVPGHKRGRGNKDLLDFLGEKCMSVDVNSMKSVDNLCHPVSAIKEAEEIAAEAFGAGHAFLMLNGTTSAVQAMIMSSVSAGDKIIMPRNVHRSAINALILCGGIPVYVNPKTDYTLGISLGMSLDDVREAIKANSGVKAIFVNNPTYYGICSDIAGIVKLAHENNIRVLADEAHGAHFYFGEGLPISAMAAGADMAAVSMHKSGGSLTQSSFLLTGKNVDANYVRQVINLWQTTSGSYLLMSSLDISRRNLALNGKEIFNKVIELAEYAREEINNMGDYYAFSKELINGTSVADFDITKLVVNTANTGLNGIEVHDILRDEYLIQVEFGDIANMLAYVSVGDRWSDIERLVGAMSEIRRNYKRESFDIFDYEYLPPKVLYSPQKAFYEPKISLDIDKCAGHISGEYVMCYPPGIPIIAPGELITKELKDYIKYCKAHGCRIIGTADENTEKINVIPNTEVR